MEEKLNQVDENTQKCKETNQNIDNMVQFHKILTELESEGI